MNREIKFRAFHKERKNLTSAITIEFLAKEAELKLADTVDNYEFTQYTGLKDKNGVEIYEGDLMKDKFGATSQIVYVTDFGRFMKLSKIGYSPLNQAQIISDNDNVIGNIYENTDLLK